MEGLSRFTGGNVQKKREGGFSSPPSFFDRSGSVTTWLFKPVEANGLDAQGVGPDQQDREGQGHAGPAMGPGKPLGVFDPSSAGTRLASLIVVVRGFHVLSTWKEPGELRRIVNQYWEMLRADPEIRLLILEGDEGHLRRCPFAHEASPRGGGAIRHVVLLLEGIGVAEKWLKGSGETVGRPPGPLQEERRIDSSKSPLRLREARWRVGYPTLPRCAEVALSGASP